MMLGPRKEQREIINAAREEYEEEIRAAEVAFDEFDINLPSLLATADRKTRALRADLEKQKNLTKQLQGELERTMHFKSTGYATPYHKDIADRKNLGSELQLEAKQLEVSVKYFEDLITQYESEADAYFNEAQTAKQNHESTVEEWRQTSAAQ